MASTPVLSVREVDVDGAEIDELRLVVREALAEAMAAEQTLAGLSSAADARGYLIDLRLRLTALLDEQERRDAAGAR